MTIPNFKSCPVLLFLLSLLMTLPTFADNNDDLESLKQDIKRIYRDSGNVALGIAVVDNGRVAWIDTLGQQELPEGKPANQRTRFHVGSISKMFVALSALKLTEQNELDLQTPLYQLAPEVKHHNPWENSDPVRLVHLLEHTTGWPDWSFAELAYTEEQSLDLLGDLNAFPEGRRSRWPPGTRMAYSNVGAAVAAYVVENVSGVDFYNYVQDNILTPLDMYDSGFVTPNQDKLARPHINGAPVHYRPQIYYPSSAFTSSPADMAQLLLLFLGSSENLPLSTETILRMQAPTTTLGNSAGITAGYGLANRTRGFKEHGVVFHGHDGRIPGAMATLSYSPSLNSGYFLALTGSGAGAQKLLNTVNDYLLRNHAKPETKSNPTKESVSKWEGYYQQVQFPVDFMNFLPTALTSIQISLEKGELIAKGATPFSSKRDTIFIPKNNVLIDKGTGLQTAALVDDPLIGNALQIGSTLYQETSKVRLWLPLLCWIAILALSALTLICAIILSPIRYFRGKLEPPGAELSFWAALSSLTFLVSALYPILNPLDITRITPWSWPSTFLFALTLGYALCSMLGVISLKSLRKIPFRLKSQLPLIMVIISHGAMSVYLALHGLIGVRLWSW
ncbi:serine hydrolase domain-containing protein [Marinimicrobium sp. ARAG 43.8]|uniref:serine hydrolase domain-containing protein n=1 Tax=Marinimicrobium sp. ARAG 43.8 TaxID=3418719 RepID=UPI003CF12DEE